MFSAEDINSLSAEENVHRMSPKVYFMNQTNIYIEGSAAPKRIPAIVPMAYQAVAVLQDKIEQVSAMNLRSNAGTVNVNREDAVIPLWNRYSLSVPEAAKYFGIGEGRLYQIIAEHPGADFILEVGSHVRNAANPVKWGFATIYEVI